MTKANCPTLAEWCGDVWLDAIPVRLASVPRPDPDAAYRLRAEFERVYGGRASRGGDIQVLPDGVQFWPDASVTHPAVYGARAGAVTPSMDGPVPRVVLGAAETNGYPHGRAAVAAFAPAELTAEEADELDAIVYGARAEG